MSSKTKFVQNSIKDLKKKLLSQQNNNKISIFIKILRIRIRKDPSILTDPDPFGQKRTDPDPRNPGYNLRWGFVLVKKLLGRHTWVWREILRRISDKMKMTPTLPHQLPIFCCFRHQHVILALGERTTIGPPSPRILPLTNSQNGIS